MFALTAYVKSSNHTSALQTGALYGLPAELRDKNALDSYARISSPGWGVLEFGYEYFAIRNSTGELYIFPGLIIEGRSKIKKKFYGYNISFSKKQIEDYARGIVDAQNSLTDKAQLDLNLLIHDLRSLSNTIYNAALEAENLIERGNKTEAIVRIQNVIAAQTILKIRTDALDFSGNTASLFAEEAIPVFKRVDKVCRALKPQCFAQGKDIEYSGTSFGKIYGPNVFEVVPYIILDNAIKYSPRRTAIEVSVFEKETLDVCISSLGPKIEQNEKALIFEKGIRGKAAISRGVPGSGLGLNLASNIISHFGGTIIVEQDPYAEKHFGMDYYYTTFIIRLKNFSVSEGSLQIAG